MVQSSLLNFFKPQVSKNEVTVSYPNRDSSFATSRISTSQIITTQSGALKGRETERIVPQEVIAPQSLTNLPEVKAYQTPHPSLVVSSVTIDSLTQIRRLTGTLLPITYPNDFYEEAASLDPTRFLSRQAIFTSDDGSKKPVGWIRCRLEALPNSTPPKRQTVLSALSDGLEIESTQIYIQALCLLAPYRGYGAATALLDAILSDTDTLRALGVLGVYAHVWEANTDALAWYKKRGFEQKELVQAYYRKLKPSGAWIVSRPINLADNTI